LQKRAKSIIVTFMESKFYKNEGDKAFARSGADGLFIKPFGEEEYQAKGAEIEFWHEITQGSEIITEEEYNRGS
jgi:hypothetical protein